MNLLYDNDRQIPFSELMRFYYERIVPRPQSSLLNDARPEGVDVSRWNETFNPDLSQHPIEFAFQKLTEGTTWIDPKIEEIWSGVAKVTVRGGYHYIRSGYSWQTQANHFLSVFFRHDYHIAVVDLEVNNSDNVLSDAFYRDTRYWIDEVRRRTGKRVMLYSNGSIWTSFKAAIRRLFQDGDTWLAGLDFWYAWPSLTVTDPLMPCKIWQYRWDGRGYGTGSLNCDVNRFMGTLAELHTWAGVATTPPPTNDVTTTPYNGITSVKGERYGQKIYVKKCSPNVRARVVNEYSRPSVISNREGADVAWNGASWDITTGKPETNEYALLVHNSGFAVGDRYTTPNIQASSIVRPLIRNGVNVSLTAGAPEWTEKHARSGMFVSRDGGIVHVTVDGDFIRAGVTLWQLAQIALEFGAWNGGDHGGGGDSVEIEGGVIVNVPDDEVNGVHYERTVAQTILVFEELESGGSNMRYEAIAISEGTRLRPDHNTNNAHYSSWPSGTVFKGDVLFVAPEKLFNAAGVQYQSVGDKWLEVKEISGAVATGWVAITNMGSPICTLTDHGVPPPPPSGEPAVMEIMLADGSAVIIRDAQGNELFKWP